MEIRKYGHLTPVQSLPSDTPAAAAVRGQGSGSGEFQVSLSARALGDLAKLVNGASGIRQEKVDAVKRQIDSGSYHINLDKLAERLCAVV